MAVDGERKANVGRLALFHHAPTSSDEVVAAMEREAQAILPSAIAAAEGLVIDL